MSGSKSATSKKESKSLKAKNNFFTAAVGSTLMPVVAVLLTALLPLSALAEDKPMPAAAEPRDDEFRDGKAPTVITSEKLRIDTARKIGIFTGDVFVNDSQFTMSADEMRVFFNEKENGIDEVVAQGRVVLTQTGGEENTARGEQAVYTVSKGEIVLTGNPSVKQGANTISGKVIRFFRNQNKMIVEGGTRLLIYDTEGANPIPAP